MPRKKKIDNDVFCDIEMERQFLHYAATVNWSVVSGVNAVIFYGQGCRAVYGLLFDMQSHFPPKMLKKVVVSAAPVQDRQFLSDEVDSILASMLVGTKNAAIELLKRLNELYQLRSLDVITDAARKMTLEGNATGAMLELQKAFAMTSAGSVERGDYIQDFKERFKLVQNRQEGKTEIGRLIPTGIDVLDELLGGAQKSEVGVLVGPTGVGKSAGLLNFAVAAWIGGFNVVHVGLEMARLESEFRMDAMLSQIQSDLFRTGNLSKRDLRLWKKSINRHAKKENYVEFVSGRGLLLREILSLIETVESERGCVDLVILDQLTHLKSVREQQRQDFHMQLWAHMEELTEWALKHPAVCWTASQVTDEGYRARGGMRAVHIKYGRAIAEFAQLVVALYQSEENEISEEMTCRVVKARGAKSGVSFKLRPDLGCMLLDRRSMAKMGLMITDELGK